ncbi:winged helix-turn-helix domain-containing protein [Selenihalanaerobacter shriftii]|uniref:HB1, ASXL, restriction endonuclease HTH domain n=1 Tax=Selenihalanaerobacter shriftii TaxID=142842 RepID=A0A1T4PAL0_9FIRM|nr:winged helix-turn-helix domain-containing protein [Selenihalanaerobacter shriftii]SJZ88590.1 HB1, ASXL, restriction endonuclease HTH domain [Selenihalanaerobacter shriftii]
MSEAYDLTKVMTISDMAYAILSQNAAPLHYKEIYEEISKVKKVKNPGSVQSCIYAHNLFIRMGDGYWGLMEWLLNGLTFIYSLSPLEYERRVLNVNYDHELYFPGYIQEKRLIFNIKGREYECSRKDKRTFIMKKLYNNEMIRPRDRMIIKILDVNNFKYEIVDVKKQGFELNLVDHNKKIRDLAFKVLKEERRIMSSTRILENILTKDLKVKDLKNKSNLGPILPLSEGLSDDNRFKEKLPGMFTLNL